MKSWAQRWPWSHHPRGGSGREEEETLLWVYYNTILSDPDPCLKAFCIRSVLGIRIPVLRFSTQKDNLSIGRYIVKMSPHVNKQGTSTVLSNPPVIFNN